MGEPIGDYHKEVLTNGSPQVYKEWSASYEEDSFALGYSGHKSVVSKWRHYYSNSSTLTNEGERYCIFDAGCGTGFIGEELAASDGLQCVTLYGGDLSPEMLQIAQSKNIYTELKIVNLNESLPYPNQYFDSVLCAGVFLQGHCGPCTLTNLIPIVKNGGLLIATVRLEYYKETRKEWEREIDKCHCILLEEELMPYRHDVNGLVLVIKKQ